MPEIFTSRRMPKVMFVNCGHGPTRRIKDMARLNFVCAGHGLADGRKPYYFSNQIRNLIKDDIITVYRNKVGYVGIARVISKPMTISEARLNNERVEPQMFCDNGNMFDSADDAGYAECLIEIEWLTGVHLSNNHASGACYGMFASRMVVCSLDNQKVLQERLESTFSLSFQKLLADSSINPLKSKE